MTHGHKTPVGAGWLADRRCVKYIKWYTLLPKVPWNFHTLYTVYKCGRGTLIGYPLSNTTLHNLFTMQHVWIDIDHQALSTNPQNQSKILW